VSARVLAAALLLGAAGLWLAVTLPALRERDSAYVEFAQVRQQREQLRSQLAASEARSAALRSPEAGAAAVRAVRASLLRASSGLGVADVQIATSGSGGRPGASGQLSAEGRMAEVVTLADRLARRDSGVRVEHVHFAASGGGSSRMRVDLDCATGSAGP